MATVPRAEADRVRRDDRRWLLPHLVRRSGRTVRPRRCRDAHRRSAWTKLVAVIDAADTAEWTPQELLALARDLAVDGQDGANLDPTQLATALPWRVEAVLAHSTPVPGEGEIEPVSPEAEEAAAAAAGVWLVEDAPTDAHLTTRPAATERTEPEIVADDEIEYDVALPTDTDAPLDPDLPPAPADYEFDRTDERGLLTPADAAELDSIDDWAAELLARHAAPLPTATSSCHRPNGSNACSATSRTHARAWLLCGRPPSTAPPST
ncbi:hypothetical protein GS500_23530 [Rhodococcus hoagii]|nr:hypothetical protein [Prescottella equi]